MTRFVALLGSINVGGNRLKMDALRAAFERTDFANVATVGASGNVLFDHVEAADAQLEREVAGILADKFGIATFAAVRSHGELSDALAESPFAGKSEDRFVHIGFLDGALEMAKFERLVADHAGRGREKLAPGTDALHIDYVDGAGDSKLTKQFIERRIERQVTVRNLSSIRRIIEKMG